jgi:3-phenylpropionate/trans-cinnamate dioxygenase ferredoxin component
VDFIRVGSLAEIPEGEVRAFDLPAGRVAVVHVEARVFAFADGCTHAGCVFDVETGEPLEGPARDPLAVHQARLVDGWVEVAEHPAA